MHIKGAIEAHIKSTYAIRLWELVCAAVGLKGEGFIDMRETGREAHPKGP